MSRTKNYFMLQNKYGELMLNNGKWSREAKKVGFDANDVHFWNYSGNAFNHMVHIKIPYNEIRVINKKGDTVIPNHKQAFKAITGLGYTTDAGEIDAMVEELINAYKA